MGKRIKGQMSLLSCLGKWYEKALFGKMSSKTIRANVEMSYKGYCYKRVKVKELQRGKIVQMVQGNGPGPWSRKNGGKSDIKKSRKLKYLRDKWRE